MDIGIGIFGLGDVSGNNAYNISSGMVIGSAIQQTIGLHEGGIKPIIVLESEITLKDIKKLTEEELNEETVVWEDEQINSMIMFLEGTIGILK